MPKPINQRGFEVSKGKFNKTHISYSINENGLECISVCRNLLNEKLESKVFIEFDEGEIKYLSYNTSQFRDSEDMEGEGWKIKSKQAMAIYHEVKKILNVDEELKKYSPRFSSESEFSPFNVLDIENASDIEPLLEEKKDRKEET